MTLWKETALLGVYTLSPTHCGTGQTTGAVDLPIARDAISGIPVLPATSLKGVLRAGWDKDEAVSLFGGEGDDKDDKGLKPGALSFTEARLLAYPARSLSRPFLHVTCPLILEGMDRILRAAGAESLLPLAQVPANTSVQVSSEGLSKNALVLEDLVFPAEDVRYSAELEKVAKALATLLPAEETATRARLEQGLVMISDQDFAALMDSAIPVQARVKLTSGKTTDKYKNADGNTESGNLWYEETLPSDCLFAALVGQRRDGNALGTLKAGDSAFRVLQIGGNETVGQGLCLTTLHLGGAGA